MYNYDAYIIFSAEIRTHFQRSRAIKYSGRYFLFIKKEKKNAAVSTVLWNGHAPWFRGKLGAFLLAY